MSDNFNIQGYTTTAQKAVEKDDRELLRACRQGDMQAWESILDKYERRTFSIARNCGLGREDATDITQLTFTFLVESLDRMTDEDNLAGWLATVTKRHSRRLLVQQLRYQSTLVDPILVEKLSPGKPKIDDIERWEIAEWLYTGLDSINDRCRQLITALYFDIDKPSYVAIAKQLGIAEGNIRPMRVRCLKELRHLLERKPITSELQKYL